MVLKLNKGAPEEQQRFQMNKRGSKGARKAPGELSILNIAF